MGDGNTASAALFAKFPSSEALKALVYFDDGALADLSAADRAELVAKTERAKPSPPLANLSPHLDR